MFITKNISQMIATFPIAINQNMTGSCFFIKTDDKKAYFACTAHQIGPLQSEIVIGLPPHSPTASRVQNYPIDNIPAIKVEIDSIHPILDLAIISTEVNNLNTAILPRPKFKQHYSGVQLCQEVIISGYPFCVLGSFLQVSDRSYISALGNRQILPGVSRKEFVIHHMTHIGTSGSPVISYETGELIGMVLGCLAPPETINAGGLPIGTDSSITFALSSEEIQKII